MASKLVFINSNRPEDSKSTAQRRAVRSQAAKDHSQPSSSKDEGPRRRRHRKLLSVELEVTLDESETSIEDSPSMTAKTVNDAGGSSPLADNELQQGFEDEADMNVDYSTMLPRRNMSGAGWTHPYVPYPAQEFVPGVLAHCKPKSVSPDVSHRLQRYFLISKVVLR